MCEHILRDFFLGRLDATALSRDLEGTMVRRGPEEAGIRIVDLPGGLHPLTAEQLVRVCDAVERGLLEPWKLEAIGFCLLASEHFTWQPSTGEGSRVSQVVGLWAAPRTRYPLTARTVAKARHLLLTGEDTFVPADREEVPDRGWNVSRTSKVSEPEPRFRDELR
jgi:hypothetical protein